jgi:hypothetical protein
MKLFKKINLNFLLLIIVAVSFCFVFIFSNRKEEWFLYGAELMDFGYAISLSFLAALIFYFFQVYLPERRRKNIIKKNMESQYYYFKEKCINLFLSSLGESLDPVKVEELHDVKKFKTFFTEDKWYKVIDNFNDQSWKELLIELEILKDEISFVLNNIQIHDKNIFDLFKNISIAVGRLKYLSISDYGFGKELGFFIFEIFGGWSLVSGQRKNDIMKDVINKI